MYKLIIGIVFSQTLFSSHSLSQNKFPGQLTGDWISIQFKYALDDSLDYEIAANISPQILTFDSLGKCTVQTTSEHLFYMSKPKKIRKYNSGEIELTYFVNSLHVYILRKILNNKEYIFLRYEKTPTAILFVRY